MKLTRYINQFWIRSRHTDENWYTYLFFAVLRVVLVFIPQKGYIHPDEFFQSMEVMTGEQFRLEHIRTWEFNTSLPVRSITLPFFLQRVPWNFLEFFAMYARYLFGIELLNSYTYLVFPRLVMCALSFINDWSMYRVCRLYGLQYEVRLLALGSSWVMLVFGTRTFSNTIELALCSLLLRLVAECMIKTNTIVYKKEILEDRYEKASTITERVKLWRLRSALPAHNFSHTLLVASVCVTGVFNRPTFLLFGAPMVFYWMLRGMGTRSITFRDFNLRMICFSVSALPALCVFIFCDSMYYKYLTVGELQMFDVGIRNFIFTPWNFLKYNMDPEKTAEHGLHPKYIHLLVNIPLLYNILGIVALVSFARLMIRFFRAEYQWLPRAQSIISLMSGAIFVPLFFLSLINHQEARFLIPLLFPIVLLHAPKLLQGFCPAYPFKEEHALLRQFYKFVLSTQASAKYVLKTWYICNIALAIFFGFIHQAGVFPLTQHLEAAIMAKPPGVHYHLITSHIYSVPLTFINIPSSQVMHRDRETGQRYQRRKDFYLYEYGSLEVPKLLDKIKLILSHCEMKLSTKQQKYKVYLAIPASLNVELEKALAGKTSNFIRPQLMRNFYPHLSTEALPRFGEWCKYGVTAPLWPFEACTLEKNDDLSMTKMVIQKLSVFVNQFGLSLYELHVQRNSKVEAQL